MALESIHPRRGYFHEGKTQDTTVDDQTTQAILSDILTELKIMNLHLTKASDEIIDREDV